MPPDHSLEIQPTSTSAASEPSRRTIAVACLGFFVITLDVSVVNVALPAIGHDLRMAVSGLQWVVDAYTLLFAALLLSAGTVSDRIGASRAYVLGLAGFTAASAACGLAPQAGVLIAARVVQGAAAALMLPASLSVIRQAYADAAGRARGIALWAGTAGVAIAAGPVAGGVLTQTLGWRWIFFVNIPFGVAGVIGLRATPRSQPRPAPLDPAGQLTATTALASLVFAVINGGAHGFDSAPTLAALTLFAATGAAFLRVESRAAHPAVPLTLFRSGTVALCTVVGFAINLGFYGAIFVLSLFFQTQRGASALTTGLMFLPMTVLITGVNVLAGRLTTRYGPRPPLVAGQLLLVAGLVALVTTRPGTPVPLLLVELVPIGVGGGLATPALVSAMLEATPAERSGLASGILNSARQIGGALGVAAFGALLAGTDGFMGGMRLSMLIGAVLLLATSACVAVLPADRRAALHHMTKRSPGFKR